MCFNTKLTKTAPEIQKRFKAEFLESYQFDIFNQVSGFNFPKTPIITNSSNEIIQMFNWGLIPSFSENEDIRNYTLNARIETITDKPSFKDVINNRCLIIANGFYEWKWHDTKGRNKEKFLIGIEDEELFAFAGIYSTWKNPFNNEIVNSYSIVTTEANDLMSEIHNIKKRMPIVLSTNNEMDWLGGKEIESFKKVETPLVAISQESQQSLF